MIRALIPAYVLLATLAIPASCLLAADNVLVMPAASIQAAASHMPKEAFAEPLAETPLLEGFVLQKIVPNSVYEKAGLKNGDRLVEINGVRLTSARIAIDTLTALRSAETVQVTLIRNEQEMIVEITAKEETPKAKTAKTSASSPDITN